VGGGGTDTGGETRFRGRTEKYGRQFPEKGKGPEKCVLQRDVFVSDRKKL